MPTPVPMENASIPAIVFCMIFHDLEKRIRKIVFTNIKAFQSPTIFGIGFVDNSW